MSGPDRRNALASGQTDVTGLDFVYVAVDQVNLDVFFLTDPFAVIPSLVSLMASQVHIHSSTLPEIPIVSMAWTVSDGRNVLHLVTSIPGDFAFYKLRIDDARIDPFFNDITFTFKANCPSDFDCEAPPHECPPETPVDFPVDTMARDFWSFRTALLDFASHRYPDWKDRLEADVGVMIAEIMSHLGDEMSYYQDRIAREASFETATQRRSLRRHARLVDYVIHDGLGARGRIDVQVVNSFVGPQVLPSGFLVWADSDSGAMVNGQFIPRRIYFEIGNGLAEVVAGKTYQVDAARNMFHPHIWDETATCLPIGATEMWIDGHHAADLPLDDIPDDKEPGRWVILRTDPTDPSIPQRRHLVRLIKVTEEIDPLAAPLGIEDEVTHLVWEDAQALPFEMDLELNFTMRGNIVPVTAGKTQKRQFSIGPSSLDGIVPRAVERTGPNQSVAYLFTLVADARRITSLYDPDRKVNTEDPDETLVWLPDSRVDPDDPRSATPEVHLTEAVHVAPNFVPDEEWQWRRSLLGVDSSEPQDTHFTLDDGSWTRVVGYRRLGGEIVHVDYLVGTGFTIRFGDGEFGRAPTRGDGTSANDTFFEVTWRAGNGKRTNVPMDAIARWRGKPVIDPLTNAMISDPTDPPLATDPNVAFIDTISNPLPTSGGLDPETAQDIKKLAPDAFRQITYRAVRPEDYAEAAERLDWVQRAGGAFRWTGSWLTCYVTADPFGAPTLTDARRDELEIWLDRFRQAGREMHVRSPKYANVDLVINVCVEQTSYPGDVEEAVLVALFGKKGVRPTVGFFDPDNFTFGTSLDRSELEAAIQRIAGVRAVEDIQIRRRGSFDWKLFEDLVYTPAADEVIRIENDPLHPDRGTVRVVPMGGA